jgi:hypothetical protein
MKNTQHTPGPWVIADDPTSEGVWIDHPDLKSGEDDEICRCLDSTLSGEECLANARLIAAAPELLDALKTLTDALNESLEPVPLAADIVNAFRDSMRAIAKAEGRAE